MITDNKFLKQIKEETIEPRETEGLKIAKASIYLFLSGLKGSIQSLLLVVWLMVGLVFASNSVPTLVGLRDTVLSLQVLIFLLVMVYNTIINFKEIKK